MNTENCNEKSIADFLKSNFDLSVKSLEFIGGGASASVYKTEFTESPFKAAVKISKFPQLLKNEYDQIKFISDRVDCGLPKLYGFGTDHENAFMVMEHFDGVSANSIKIPVRFRNALADEIADNLIKIHSVHNDKFGLIENAVYNTWYDYYSGFAKEIFNFTRQSYSEGRVAKKVYKAVEASYNNLDIILKDTLEIPVLTHGDYWTPNFIVNPENYSLSGIIDPFNVMWAEPEYELFALTVGYGKKLKLYDNYKNKINPTPLCDLKVEMYALYNELLWYQKLGTIGHNYLKYRARRLLKWMKRNHII